MDLVNAALPDEPPRKRVKSVAERRRSDNALPQTFAVYDYAKESGLPALNFWGSLKLVDYSWLNDSTHRDIEWQRIKQGLYCVASSVVLKFETVAPLELTYGLPPTGVNSTNHVSPMVVTQETIELMRELRLTPRPRCLRLHRDLAHAVFRGGSTFVVVDNFYLLATGLPKPAAVFLTPEGPTADAASSEFAAGEARDWAGGSEATWSINVANNVPCYSETAVAQLVAAGAITRYVDEFGDDV